MAVAAAAVTPVLSLVAFFSVVALMTACLWDQHAKYAVAGLYILGLIAGVMRASLLISYRGQSSDLGHSHASWPLIHCCRTLLWR